MAASRPILPAGMREFFLTPQAAAVERYSPVLYAAARVHYTDSRRGVDVVRDVRATVPISDGAVAVDWDAARDERSGSRKPGERSAVVGSVRAAARCGPRPAPLCRVAARLRALDRAQPAAAVVGSAVTEADLATRRERARLPHPPATGRAREPGCERRNAARPLRRPARAGDGQAQSCGAGGCARAAADQDNSRRRPPCRSAQRCSVR